MLQWLVVLHSCSSSATSSSNLRSSSLHCHDELLINVSDAPSKYMSITNQSKRGVDFNGAVFLCVFDEMRFRASGFCSAAAQPELLVSLIINGC